MAQHLSFQTPHPHEPNAWFPHQEAFIAAVRRIVHLSAETVRIVEGLPAALEGLEEG